MVPFVQKSLWAKNKVFVWTRHKVISLRSLSLMSLVLLTTQEFSLKFGFNFGILTINLLDLIIFQSYLLVCIGMIQSEISERIEAKILIRKYSLGKFDCVY